MSFFSFIAVFNDSKDCWLKNVLTIVIKMKLFDVSKSYLVTKNIFRFFFSRAFLNHVGTFVLSYWAYLNPAI